MLQARHPFEDASQLDDILLTTHVNGELRQEDRTSRMMFSIRRQIEYISTFTTLVALRAWSRHAEDALY